MILLSQTVLYINCPCKFQKFKIGFTAEALDFGTVFSHILGELNNLE